ncbi:MAG: acyl-CoA dehydrogenase family protein [Candidatus Tectomicrobia bacterium]|uniref:Acyl-CoA dehydrogenase family protein n=1 Tax=Tectimicrobiota bacterium TaxID=2528274 RepID=A0A932HXD5_UNCTE|nr:acyl-CoA dehydrogenase family protein [Candidatus Tectomicrobia bacterium]
MDFELNETQRLIRQQAADFAAQKIAPFARQNDIEGRVPVEIIQEMGALGMFGGVVPEEYGGAGLDYIAFALLCEEIGKADSSVRTVLSVQISLVAAPILKFGTEAQKKKYLPRLCKAEWIGCFALTEPDAGSDVQQIKTFARKTSAGWKLDGRKLWISNGGIAQLAIIIAQTERGNPRGMAAFLVETSTPGFSSRDIHGKLGLRASNTAELVLDGVEVPDEALLGEVGQGFPVAMAALDNGRYSVAAGCLGIARGSLEASVAYAKERHSFGKPIAAHQMVQDMIARMVVDVDASRLLLYRAGELKNQGRPNTLETCIAKYYCTEAAFRCANDAIQIHGGMGYSNEYPVERYLRDARVATIYEGTSQIQKLIIGGFATGIRAFG